MKKRNYWTSWFIAGVALIILRFIDPGWLPERYGKEGAVYYIVGFMVVALLFMLLDSVFSVSKKSSFQKLDRRKKLGEKMEWVRLGLFLMLVGLAVLTKYFHPEWVKPILFLGFAAFFFVCALGARITGYLPLRYGHVEKDINPITFNLFVFAHFIVSVGFVVLYFTL